LSDFHVASNSECARILSCFLIVGDDLHQLMRSSSP